MTQYRLLVNDIHANNRLYHWKIVDSQGCDYCTETKQNIVHLLFECPVICKVWDQLYNYIKENLIVDPTLVQINAKNIFLNKVYPKPTHLVNFLVLIVKQYIHAKKCLKESLDFKEIVKKFQSMYKREKYNALYNNKMNHHQRKWAPYTKDFNFELKNETSNVNENVENYALEYILHNM